MKITVENLNQFFRYRPKLSPSGVSQEAGFSAKYLRLILSGERPLTDTAITKLEPVLHLHGWGRERKEKENPQAKHTADNGNDFIADVSKSTFTYNAMKEQTNRKVVIRKGCLNQQCFCTGVCQEIIGLRDKLPNEY